MAEAAPDRSTVQAAVAETLVRDAGALIMSRFRAPLKVEQKGRGNVVTEVDLAVEELMLARLRREFPGWGILTEESTRIETAGEYLWIVDPLDGSKNFSQGLPIFAVNLALAKAGEVILGLTYDPNRDELFLAERGRGAFLNGQPIHVADRRSVSEGLLGFEMGYDNDKARLLLEFLHDLWPGVQSLRNIGSAALQLAFVAAGRTDAFIHHLLSPWDFAPGLLLVREAGGVVTERDGTPVSLQTRGLVAANPAVHADLLRLAAGSEWARAGLAPGIRMPGSEGQAG